MLSIGRIGAGNGYTYLQGQVASADVRRARERLHDYYARSGMPAGRWVGSGLGSLELSGEVTEEQLGSLFGRGEDWRTREPLGQRFYRSEGPGVDRRSVAGFDLTFSPPKSVSLAWAVGDEARQEIVSAAHHHAVDTALAWIESDVLRARVGHNGTGQVEVEGLVGAAFDHWYSRAGDPQLHTHVAILNRVRSDDGKWRTIDGRVLYQAARAAGELYTWALRSELTAELGVEWRNRQGRDERVALPEIASVPDSLIAAFSSRSADIEADLAHRVGDYLDAHGRHPDRSTLAKLAQDATLATRQGPGREREWHAQREHWLELAGGELSLEASANRQRQVPDLAELARDVLAHLESQGRPSRSGT